ncbi:2-amino-4-hydroxy-6-hydroxymethyldihydropteridine diphosphokinase [candidate division WOR-3 bacterium JGI_Cruoil_03_51_56]|uniref:2-amino-4-hydroxy-6-hydroxymethyldihydropteridine diphosphokinase n=1 Tax=candidate division WOR-3 bacterium JGI_Cruoil_03_51_56 TaxID=1973747 RepID=A0A235BWS3_UNCW3|nr:MAG: 2-amino-4-hydroxy-6-hydroxymethyldihydropteridine diphosphokinase [candidate division WOR-3 bacterium JGI_Cruoil_03_51_56]
MSQVFLGLGSNLGNRLANLEKAVAGIGRFGAVRRSSWYETEPVGLAGAGRFLNGVVSLETNQGPFVLLDNLVGIEQGLGRDPKRKDGSRTIDIDILLYGQQVISNSRLVIPHPRMHQRAFVLVPLVELAPDTVHPLLGVTVLSLLQSVETREVKVYTES